MELKRAGKEEEAIVEGGGRKETGEPGKLGDW